MGLVYFHLHEWFVFMVTVGKFTITRILWIVERAQALSRLVQVFKFSQKSFLLDRKVTMNRAHQSIHHVTKDGQIWNKHTFHDLDLLKLVGKKKRYSRNGGLMVIYQGTIRKESPIEQKDDGSSQHLPQMCQGLNSLY